MSEGGTTKKQLERVTQELEAEYELWKQEQINPEGWQMGGQQLLFRCELLALLDIVKDKLGVTEDELTLALRTRVLQQLQQLRPQVIELRRNDVMQRLTDGIVMKPPKPENGMR